jgi:hypothetical protein
MKKLLLTALLVTLSVAAFAQGTVNFSNFANAPLRLKYSTSPGGYYDYASYIAHQGQNIESGAAYNVALLYQPVGSTTYTVYSTATMSGTAGYFNAGTAYIPGYAQGSTVNLLLQVWQSSYASFDDAVSSGGFFGDSYPFSVVVSGGTSSPAKLAFTAFAIHQLIPEPTITALGLFGIAGLFLARRRH